MLGDGAAFDLAVRLRSRAGAPLGELFAFLSGLYFRGKLAYAQRFASAPAGLPGVLVITTCEGLRPPGHRVGRALMRRYASVPIDRDERRYTGPLERDARELARAMRGHPGAKVVLLGSIATAKYGGLLGPILGDRLVFPSEFVGRGDMSRGGLMLRCVDQGRELACEPLGSSARRGPRPPRLEVRSRVAPAAGT